MYKGGSLTSCGVRMEVNSAMRPVSHGVSCDSKSLEARWLYLTKACYTARAEWSSPVRIFDNRADHGMPRGGRWTANKITA